MNWQTVPPFLESHCRKSFDEGEKRNRKDNRLLSFRETKWGHFHQYQDQLLNTEPAAGEFDNIPRHHLYTTVSPRPSHSKGSLSHFSLTGKNKYWLPPTSTGD